MGGDSHPHPPPPPRRHILKTKSTGTGRGRWTKRKESESDVDRRLVTCAPGVGDGICHKSSFQIMSKKCNHKMREIISERWEIRSADLKIDKSSLALDGHGDEGSGSNVSQLDQDAAYSSLTRNPKPFCGKINHKIFSGILTTQTRSHGIRLQAQAFARTLTR